MDLPFDLPFDRVMGLTATGWLVLAVTNIPVYIFLAWVWFNDLAGFLEALKFWVTPDVISTFRGEYADDWWAEKKIFLWLFSCAACVVVEAQLLQHFFGS